MLRRKIKNIYDNELHFLQCTLCLHNADSYLSNPKEKMKTNPQYKLIYMSVKQFAAHKGEHPVTIERKILAGIIKSEQDAPRCQHKIPVRIRVT